MLGILAAHYLHHIILLLDSHSVPVQFKNRRGIECEMIALARRLVRDLLIYKYSNIPRANHGYNIQGLMNVSPLILRVCVNSQQKSVCPTVMCCANMALVYSRHIKDNVYFSLSYSGF
jgi:hypothetical protein